MLSLGFDWSALSMGSLVVDVGGGMGYGGYTMEIAERYPHLNFIVQTTTSFVEEGQKVRRVYSVFCLEFDLYRYFLRSGKITWLNRSYRVASNYKVRFQLISSVSSEKIDI